MPSDSADLERVKQLFHAARELTSNERQPFLDQNCGEDRDLRREIEALLKSSDETRGFLFEPPAHLAAEAFGGPDIASTNGRTIGRYKVLKRIGSGGMGDVYLAERADQQFEMRVAVKLIKRGMDTESVLRHFRNERQILASLDHPNIARLLDGGETSDGLPYLVMEYIEGLPIEEYCNKQALTIPERLKLFREVCAAVSYAHRHLVIHRDIKRSNILVTAGGVPKLLDFGIAKILQTGEGAPTFATMTGQRLMTPEYASPEQVLGQSVTTATDVYSLGVILYELLTGQFPYRFASKTPQDIERVISTEQPEKPSTAIARSDENPKSVSNRSDTVRSCKFLKGDLDNIVLMALRKEPERRYQSVEQFSEDIRRHLEARPVLARKDTAGYRAGKFVRRNKLALAAAALIFVSLLGGIVATTLEAYRTRQQKALAERRFNDVRKLAHSVLFDYHDAIRDLPGSTKVRERLVRDALSYLDSLSGEARDDPALQRELAAAYEKVGDIRGGGASAHLGDEAGALESYTKALRIREALLATNPRDPQARRDVAESETAVALQLLDYSQKGDALQHARKALAMYTELTQEQPDNNDFQLEFADTHAAVATAMSYGGDDAGALEHRRATLNICERLAAKYPREPRYRRALWVAHEGVSRLRKSLGDIPGAITENDEALVLGEALVKENPLNADYRRTLVRNYQQAGDFRRQTDRTHILDYFRKAAALNEELVNADPANAATRGDLGYTYKRIADYSANEKKNTDALAYFGKAVAVYEKLAADSPADVDSRFDAAACRAGVAAMEARLGRIDAAVQECNKTRTLVEGITDETAGTRYRSKRAEVYENLGYAYQFLAESTQANRNESKQHTTSARDMFRQALKILEDARSRGLLDANGALWAKGVADEIAKCDVVLGK